jgi:hypothetical protein
MKERLNKLISQPRHRLGILHENEVPENNGVYLIYEDKSMVPIYIGATSKAIERKPSGQPSGLRFRIMRNHMRIHGADNVRKYLASELRRDEKQAIQYLKDHCSCQWLEDNDLREVFLLEHFAIAVFNPRLNRG